MPRMPVGHRGRQGGEPGPKAIEVRGNIGVSVSWQRRRFWIGTIALHLGLTLVGTYPVWRHLDQRLPGVPGDNYVYAWNIHHLADWSRGNDALFRTRMLFSPYGADLRFHTLNLTGSLVGVPLLRSGMRLPTVVGILWLLSFAASGIAATWFVLRVTGSSAGALVAGLYFAFLPARTAHALGHLDLASTYWLPLAAGLAWIAFPLDGLGPARTGLRSVVATGVAAGLAALTSWYFMVDLILLGLLWGIWLLGRRRLGLGRPALLLLAAALTVAPAALPMLRAAAGGRAFYRIERAPISADLVALVLPTPLNPLIGAPIARRLRSAGPRWKIPEQTVGLGWVAIALALLGWPQTSRMWRFGTVLFLVLSLGPRLHFFGRAVPIPMPWTILRHVPILSGASILARYAIMTGLCMLPAIGAGVSRLAAWRLTRHPVAVVGMLVFLVVAEQGVFGFPTTNAGIPDYLVEMRADPSPGSVFHLPAPFQRRTLYLQSRHGRPLAGGWVARFEPSLRERMMTSIGEFRQLLRDGGVAAGSRFREELEALGVRYLVLETRMLDTFGIDPSDPKLKIMLATAFPAGPWRKEGSVHVYRVK